MGWTPPRKVYVIEPESGDYSGFRCKIESVPFGEFISLASLADKFEDIEGSSKITDGKALQAFGEIGQLFSRLGSALIEWNVQLPVSASDPDGPQESVPADASGVARMDMDFILWLFGTWLEAMGGVSAPLGQTPSQGGSSAGTASMEIGLAEASRPNS